MCGVDALFWVHYRFFKTTVSFFFFFFFGGGGEGGGVMLYIKGSYSLHTINVQCLLSPICIALRYFNMLCAGERAVAERHMEEACAANIRRFRQVRWVNHSSLSELFISFLEKVIISVMLSTLMKNLGCRHLDIFVLCIMQLTLYI